MTPYDKAFREGQLSVLNAIRAVADNTSLARRTRRALKAVTDVFEKEISRRGNLAPVHLASSVREALSTRREGPQDSSEAPRD